jgi:cation diffusion facilitator family transporter
MSEYALKECQKIELFALKLSIVGTFFMAILGLTFALLTHSEAILLDGVFSLVLLVMSLITLAVAKLVVSPDSHQFQFGFAHFEPLWNTLRALIVLVICAFAFFAAIDDLLHGGRNLQFGLATIYSVIATLGCALIAFFMARYRHKSQSSLVAIDAKAWFVDTIISCSILIGFIVIYFAKNTFLNEYLAYVDPLLVAVIVLIVIPIPIKLLKENLREVFWLAPDLGVQQEIKKRINDAIIDYDVSDVRIRLAKLGRYITLNAYIIVPASFKLNKIEDLDDIREKIKVKLLQYHPNMIFDIVFTADKTWSE